MNYIGMTTKQIGNIGEIKTIAKFVELGIPVYLPFGDNEKADIVADFGGKLNRIQVKTSCKAEDGKMIFSLVSSTVHRQNGVKHIYTDDEIDYFATFWDNQVYVVPVNETSSKKVLRFESSINSPNISWAEDYTLEEVFQL